MKAQVNHRTSILSPPVQVTLRILYNVVSSFKEAASYLRIIGITTLAVVYHSVKSMKTTIKDLTPVIILLFRKKLLGWGLDTNKKTQK